MVGGDESNGIAPGQWGRDRNWQQRVGAQGKGSMARGHLDPGLAEAKVPSFPPPPAFPGK